MGPSDRQEHWSARLSQVPEYLADGFDGLARLAGSRDGLSLLLEVSGATFSEVEQASAAEIRQWYYKCYDLFSGDPGYHCGDVAAIRRGVSDPVSGWDRRHRPRLRGRMLRGT